MKHNSSFFAIFFVIALCGMPFSALAEEPKGVQGDLNAASKTRTASGKSTSDSNRAPAQATRANDESSQKTQTSNRTKPSIKAVGKVKQTVNATTKRSQTDARFVDRDGDGLRDGKEHRFRGRYRRDNNNGREATSPQRVLRLRYRNSTNGTTPQQGSQGRRGQ
jgi:hypothetical protein